MTERKYTRHAWKILFAISLVFGLFGVGDLISGAAADDAITQGVTGKTLVEIRAADPTVANLLDVHVRSGGAVIVAFSLLAMAISATAYRRGERWAWFALWSWPLILALIPLAYLTTPLVPGVTPPPLLSAPIFAVLALLGLLLPYRQFFPKQDIAGRK